MATYSTDLTTLTTAESGTWTEFAAPYNGGGSPGASGENFIQGTDCYAQNSGKANGLEISIVFDAGSGQTFATDEVLLAWAYYSVGTNLETYANNGWRFGIGSSTSAWDWFVIGGSDYGRNPYGGWVNVAIDPTATETGTIGGGNGGTYRYFGNVPYTINEITKGDPTAVDAMRIGRGEISVTGTGSTFTELAEYNDYNAGSTPPGTSSTSIDTGRHRLGLFQENGGVFVWKGLMSMGITATSVTFTDSNETIIIDDAPHTYADFNKIEVNNASSTINWTSITFISTGTTAPGYFEVIADTATVNLTTCSFNAMGTFILGSGTTADSCSWNGCGLITLNEADISGSSVLEPTVAADEGAVFDDRTTTVSTSISELDNCTFSQGANAHHAIRFGANVNDDITLTGIEFTGFSSVADSTGATLRFDATSGTMNCNLVGCTVGGVAASSSNVGVDDAAGITVTVAAAVDVTINVVDEGGTAVSTAQTSVYLSSDNSEVMNEDTVAGVASASFSGTTPADCYIRVRKGSTGATKYFPGSTSGTIESITGLTTTVVLREDTINST